MKTDDELKKDLHNFSRKVREKLFAEIKNGTLIAENIEVRALKVVVDSEGGYDLKGRIMDKISRELSRELYSYWGK